MYLVPDLQANITGGKGHQRRHSRFIEMITSAIRRSWQRLSLPPSYGLEARYRALWEQTRGPALKVFRTPRTGLSSVPKDSDPANPSVKTAGGDGEKLPALEGDPWPGRYFADSRDPLQHPLAPLSTEEMQERREHMEKVQISTKPPVYIRKLTADGQAFAIGSRKRSRAKVWLRTGSGKIVVNGRPWVDYFQRLDHRDKILRPFGLLDMMGKMDVTCDVLGGGQTGQAEAMRHAISRALQNWDPLFRPTLKENGLLTRDSRAVESKKYGRKKARKAFQWVKR